jgi:membrane-associated phospholipid phosphatase
LITFLAMLFPATNAASPQRLTDSAPRWPLLAAACLLALAPPCLLIDLPVSKLCLEGGVPGEIHRLLTWSEVVAHGCGVAIVALAIWVLDPAHRRRIPRLLAAAYGAGLVVHVFKLVIARYRPKNFDLELGVGATFAGWLPLVHPIDGFRVLDSRLQSFPSGHAAVAVALAFGLARIYPHGRAFFALLALLAAAQRIEAGAHYLSDTLAGAAIGALVFAWLDSKTGPGRWLHRFESVVR